MKIKNLIILILFLALTACDCQYHLSGVVLDNLTFQPIENVAIKKTYTTDLDTSFKRDALTKRNGSYEIYGVAGKCKEITMYFKYDGYKTHKAIFPNNSTDTILLQPIAEQQTRIFDNNKDFKILELKKSNDYPSSDKDTLPCIRWTLNEAEIKEIIKESKPISGPEWNNLFGHYSCQIHGKLIQGTNEFDYSINSGAWFTVSSPDTTLRFGSFEKENNKYFLDIVWTEQKIEGNE